MYLLFTAFEEPGQFLDTREGLGDDYEGEVVYIVDKFKRVFILVEIDQKVKEVDLSFLLSQNDGNSDLSFLLQSNGNTVASNNGDEENTNYSNNFDEEKEKIEKQEKIKKVLDEDNFADFISTLNSENSTMGGFGCTPSSARHIKILNRKIFFYDLKSSIIMYNLESKIRIPILTNLKETEFLILHLNADKKQLIIFNNTLKIYVYNILNFELWTYTINNILIPNPSSMKKKRYLE